jgi:ABC-type polysaccharide/polyol phosphate export permease
MNRILVMFTGFIKYQNLLSELVVRDIKIRYRKSVLGILWTLLNPLMMMIVMTMVFSSLFITNIPYFPVYFLTGSILFTFNSEATTQALTSIISNAGLIKKVYIPKYLFPFSRVLSSLVNFIFAFVALLLVMLFTNAPFKLTLLLSFLPLFYLIMFTTGLSLVLSALTVFFRDINHLYGVLTLVWTYMTPLFYPISIIPAKYRWIFEYNPMYYYIKYFRDLVLYGIVPGLSDNLICFLMGLLMLILGLILFYKSQDKFILHM